MDLLANIGGAARSGILGSNSADGGLIDLLEDFAMSIS